MDLQLKGQVLQNAQDWFKDTISVNHIKNTKKLENVSEFNINPFLAVYLANFLCGNSDPESIAKALIYPSIGVFMAEAACQFNPRPLHSLRSRVRGMIVSLLASPQRHSYSVR